MNLWKCHSLLEINILFWVGTYVLDDSRIRYIHVRCLDMSPFTDFEQPLLFFTFYGQKRGKFFIIY